MPKRRHQPSTVDKLPPEISEEINRLRTQYGWSIDQLVEFVKSKGENVSRAAMGRHVRSLHLDVDEAAEELQHSQAISKAVMDRFGKNPDNELARLNIQLLQGQVFDMILAEKRAVDEEGNRPPGDSLKLVRLSKAVQQLLSAEKMNAERVKEIKQMAIEEERARASAALEDAVDKGTMRREALAEAKRIMGYD